MIFCRVRKDLGKVSDYLPIEIVILVDEGIQEPPQARAWKRTERVIFGQIW